MRLFRTHPHQPRLAFLTLLLASALAQACASPRVPQPSTVDEPSSEPAQPEQGGLGISGLNADEKGQFTAAQGKGRAIVLPGAITVTGTASADAVRRMIDQNLGRFRLCYGARLAKNPTLHGSIAVTLAIDPSGAVTNATSDGSALGDPELFACVAKQFTRLRVPPFPAPSATASVVLAFLSGD
jgi:hypothetical protein